MKKILGLLVIVMVLNGCDDGELTIENIDFSDVTASDCENIIYKLKNTEALFFEVENPATLFANDATLEGAPRTVDVDDDNRIFYRAYSGEITSENICGSILPATPSVIEEWTFTGGQIQVTTIPIIEDNAALPGGEKITQYRHHIIFAGVTKNTPSGSELMDLDFGFLNTTPETLSFSFGETLNKCSTSNVITSINGSAAITLDIDPALIASAETPIGVPNIGFLGTTTNKLKYSLFQTAVAQAYFCEATTPTTPVLKEQWIGDAGVDVSGIIEVTTTSSVPGVFEHEIHLKNVTFRKGNSAFKLADDYTLGILTTN
jgi:hypothetical protein